MVRPHLLAWESGILKRASVGRTIDSFLLYHVLLTNKFKLRSLGLGMQLNALGQQLSWKAFTLKFNTLLTLDTL